MLNFHILSRSLEIKIIQNSYLFMLWHMRGMSLARNIRDSQCGASLLEMPQT